MTQPQEISHFEKMVLKAETSAQGNMSLYKFKLTLYALLGYVVIFSIVIALFGLVGGIVAAAFLSTGLFLLLLKKKLFLVLIPTIWVLLKALWVRFESPAGYSLKRKDFPELYQEIDRLRKILKAPKIHQVILTPELNASISQTPRLGILGWNKNTLTLGLELLLTLSPNQASAVLAHEFGHLSGNHSRFNSWIYRIRLTWYRIMEAFDQVDSFGAKLMGRFFDWYAPQFAAYSFALARTNEYEADTISAELTSVNCTGAALINAHVTGPYVDDHYWNVFFEKADSLPKPDHTPWIGLRDFLRSHQPAQDQLTDRLENELNKETVYDDTHPALHDRLKALEVSPVMPEPTNITAAEIWLGDQFMSVIKEFDKEWMEHNEQRWKDRYDYVVDSKKTLSDLKEKMESELDDEELWKKAILTEEFEPDGDALTLFYRYQKRCPDDPVASFMIGRMLYTQNDESFLEQMKIALGQPDLVINACQYAYYYLSEKNRNEEAQWWREKAEQQIVIDQASQKERSILEPEDPIEKAEISTELLNYIVETLKSHRNVKKAWIASKRMEYYPESPALAIAVTTRGFIVRNDKITSEVADRLALNCCLFVVAKAGDHKSLARKIIRQGDQIL